MNKKQVIFFLISFCLILSCTPKKSDAKDMMPLKTDSQDSAQANAEVSLETYTLEQLSQYNGKNGQPAWVAVDGRIYDVSMIPQWRGGEHNGYKAGIDATDIIKNKSPHGLSVLKKLKQVGILAK